MLGVLIARMVLVVVALCLNASVRASPEPSPPPPAVAGEKSPLKVEANQQTAPTQQGTRDNPVVVKGIEAERAAEHRAQERDDSLEKHKRETDLVYWTYVVAIATGVLAALTFILACIAGGQLLMFWFQLRLTQKAVADAEKAACSARESADLARQEFVASHRPRMAVRRLTWIIDAGGSHIGVSYAIKNVGDGPGTVAAISAKVWNASSREDLPPVPPYVDAQQVNIPLKSGDWIDTRHTMDSGLINDLAFLIGFENVRKGDPKPNMLFLGYIDYVDNEGRKLQTGFLRRFDFELGRFEPIQHPDYEYQD